MLDSDFLGTKAIFFISLNSLLCFTFIFENDCLPAHSFEKFFFFLDQSHDIFFFRWNKNIFMRITKVEEVHIQYVLLPSS